LTGPVLVFLFLLPADQIFGQASTDGCGFTAGAKWTVGASCNPVTFTKPATYGADMSPTSCNGGNYDDAFGWFAGTGNPVIIQYTPPGGADALMHVFSGTCAAPVELACSDACCSGAVESVTIPTTVGTNYIIRVQRYGANNAMNGTLCVFNAPPPPANDDPCGATALTAGASCVYTNSTTAQATATAGVPAPGCANYAGGDVWFKVVVPASGGLIMDSNTGVVTDGGMALYTAPSCSGPFTLVVCDDDASANGSMPMITAGGLTPGSTVYIRFWEYGNDNPGTFSICATAYTPPSPPSNDNPCSATVAPVNPDMNCTSQAAGTVAGATPTGLATAPCFGTPDNDVWFRFTATNTTHYISLNNVVGNTTDMYHAVYSGTCGSLTNISCSDADQSTLTGLTVGNTYWVRVYTYYSNSPAANTTFNLCITTPPPPPNCGQVFYDPGGSAGDYPNSNTTVTTICPTNPGDLVRLTFTAFSTEDFIDELQIFDGNSTGAPLIGTYSGATLPPVILATNPTGCLTAQFNSDYSVTYPGWAANVACITPPAGDCLYILRLFDSAGNGWGSSSVGVRINGGPYTYYTVTGSSNYALIGVNIGDLIELNYVATGPGQGQNSYTISKLGQYPYFSSNTPPVAGIQFSQTVTCGPPPAQPQDCMGGVTVCSAQAITNNSSTTGQVADLNSTNEGCLGSGERQGTWYYFSPQTNGTIAFSIAPANGTDDYDFAVWGPYSSPQCPTGPPLRCSYDAPGPYTTGLNGTATQTTEGAAGTGWVKDIAAIAGQVYVLYIDNFSTTGQAFTLTWQLSGGSSLDCTTLPVEMLDLEALARDPVIEVRWATATEHDADHFNVQRSADNLHFATIGTAAAAGNSQFRTDYLFVDQHPLSGTNYYRLEQVDLNGTGMLTRTVVATLYAGDDRPSLFPSPATDLLHIVFAPPSDGMYLFSVLDAVGRTVASQNAMLLHGQANVELPLYSLAKGWYNLQITWPDGAVVPATGFLKQ
jgi:hypothetical protein